MNTTGWEPLSSDKVAAQEQGTHECTLLRYVTRDFAAYSTPHVSLKLDPCAGTPTIKSIARNPAGLYVMFFVLDGLGTYTSQDAGMSWTEASTIVDCRAILTLD